MKNPLELQLTRHIKTANRLFKQRDFQDAIQQYTNCLQLYEQNRKFNDSIASDFKIAILSLRGMANFYGQNFSQAQQDLDFSYQLNPYNSLTLTRRARFYYNRKRYSEAIEDISKALIYQPQNIKLQVLLSQINEEVDKLTDQTQKKRLKQLTSMINCTSQQSQKIVTSSEDQQEESVLKFSHLRKIDRVSIRKTGNSIGFREDSVVVYESKNDINDNQESDKEDPQPQTYKKADIQAILKRQEEELISIYEQSEQNLLIKKIPKIVTNTHGKSRRSVLRNSMRSESSASNQLISENRSSISAASIKNIDGKLIKHDKKQERLRFRGSCVGFITQQQDSGQNRIQQTRQSTEQKQKKRTKKNSKGRKSCMRSPSTKHHNTAEGRFISAPSNQNLSNFVPQKTGTIRPSFFGLKSIDRTFKDSDDPAKQDPTKQNRCDDNSEISSSDDENQHQVFEQPNEEHILKVLENMNRITGFSGGEKGSQRGSKKSILKRKDGSNQGSTTTVEQSGFCKESSWKKSAKKSVCFKTH